MPRTATRSVESEIFTDEDAYKTWRVIAANPQYTDTTETFGFSNGQAVIAALPKGARCNGLCAPSEMSDDCRLHKRVFHLNNLRNYPTFQRVKDSRTGKRTTQKGAGYRILSEEEYDKEFSDVEPDAIDLDDF